MATRGRPRPRPRPTPSSRPRSRRATARVTSLAPARTREHVDRTVALVGELDAAIGAGSPHTMRSAVVQAAQAAGRRGRDRGDRRARRPAARPGPATAPSGSPTPSPSAASAVVLLLDPRRPSRDIAADERPEPPYGRTTSPRKRRLSMTDETYAGAGRRRWADCAIVAVLLPLLAALVLVWSTDDRRDPIGDDPGRDRQQRHDHHRPAADGGRAGADRVADQPVRRRPAARLDAHRRRRRHGRAAHGRLLRRPHDPVGLLQGDPVDGHGHAQSGQLELQSNAAASQTVPYISEQVVAAAAQALGNQSTQAYLKQVYGGFNQIANGQQNAASSAQQLAGGTADLAARAPASSTRAPTSWPAPRRGRQRCRRP